MKTIEDKIIVQEDKTTVENTKYVIATIAAGIFMAAAYYLPAETFISFFAAVLFLIPTAFFVYMIQKVHPVKADEKQ